MYKQFLSNLTNDKVLHFLYGAVLTLPFLLLSPIFNIHILLLCLLVSFVIGLTKEVIDLVDNLMNKKTNSVEFMDIVFTVFGGLYVGIIVALLK
jgi:hypothetical protein